MNKLTMPAILVATIMVAGIFAFMPVEQASTVHASAVGGQIKSVSSIVVAGATVIPDTGAFPTADVHNQVALGYIIINTTDSGSLIAAIANLDCATWTAAGVELGANPAIILAGEFTVGTTVTYHCHIPSVAGTILVGLAANGGAVTLAAGDTVTTTIDTLT